MNHRNHVHQPPRDGLIDTSVFCGSWAFRALSIRTSKDLKAHLLDRGVSRAFVASSEAILYPDPMLGNRPLFDAIKDDPFFDLAPVIDPSLPSWSKDGAVCLDTWGCRMVKLTPNYHDYDLDDPCVHELVRRCSEAAAILCIQMRMMDERSHHPLMKVPGVNGKTVRNLADKHPDVPFLICGAYQSELGTFAGALNIWVEMSFVESGHTLPRAIETIGDDRLCFGSHSPFFYFEANSAKLDVPSDSVTSESLEKIRSANAAALLKLS